MIIYFAKTEIILWLNPIFSKLIVLEYLYNRKLLIIIVDYLF